MCKGPIIKLTVGLLLVFAGLYAILPGSYFAPLFGVTQGFAWEAFKTVLLGSIPPFLIFVGLLMVWVELEEIKIEQEEKRLKEKAEKSKKVSSKKKTKRKR